ncbi:MAG: glucuronate isomerase [Candidatus Methylacidiphilales bacterium]
MKTFITDDFLLSNDVARELYHQWAAPEPIFDYHCHLPPAEIAEDRSFQNLYEIWLAGDHYKWRAMRSNGVPEAFCTGDAPPYEKFMAFARTIPATLRNPLYHWSHLELLRYFKIDCLINEESAPKIWEDANARLAEPDMRVSGILRANRVRVICTTDDPVDSLKAHQAIQASPLATHCRVYPTFRPDKALAIASGPAWNAWVDQLAAVSGQSCKTWEGFLTALHSRHDFFHSIGGRLSDHGLAQCLADFPEEGEAAATYTSARAGNVVTAQAARRFGSYLMREFGRWDAARGWTKQLHLGAMRNNNTRAFQTLGPDTGFDSIGDYPQAEALSRYLDSLAATGKLPKIILYNLNPADNYVFATMIGNFQDGSIAGKIQFGSGWWFLDQKEGMEWQLNALSNLGLLSRFVGMLTDSRSFLSYTRHEYFRRILCNLIGTDVVKGELPRDMNLLGGMIRKICFGNAADFFGLELPSGTT